MDTHQPDGSSVVPTRGQAALAGVVAAGTSLAVGELVASFLPGAPSPLAAVGAVIIDAAPAGTKEVVVALFGTADKPALAIAISAVVLLLGAAIGLVARRSKPAAAVAVFALTAVGALSALQDPTATLTTVVLSAALQAGVGFQVLVMLLAWAAPATGTTPASRRRFLAGAGALGLAAITGALVGRFSTEGRAQQAGTAAVGIPPSVDPAPTLTPDSGLELAGITPVVTPNESFYRIDTALVTPAVELATWRLRVHGLVEQEVVLTFDDLVALPLIDRYVTIACVSNEVGGNLIGNAKWTGVRLADVLDMAGVKAEATQVVPRSVDGWAAGFPTSWVMAPDEPRDALIAVKMNDVPLPAAHGFPARLIVPGLYGYVSATKWLSDIELTTWEAFDSYWVPRGWAKEAPVLTQSRIDTPRNGASLRAGTIPLGGVAWAMDRGISRVEVRVDDGPWQEARLAEAIGPQTWVQWRFDAPLDPGAHNLYVRATDGDGVVQEERRTAPAPDGARGYHGILVQVS
jgi:DMSO/TMAO reductase YedYZ molybdopterin-dependent catalytic subunit